MDFEVECPKHSGAFDYRTGEALRLPACENLKTYPAEVIDGEVARGRPGLGGHATSGGPKGLRHTTGWPGIP